MSEIIQYAHCTRCLEELPEGESPATWSRLDVGFTAEGLQVWCRRHEVNIIHIDFEGEKHPAYTGD